MQRENAAGLESAERLLAAALGNARTRWTVLEAPETLGSLHPDDLLPATVEDCNAETVALVSAMLGDTPPSLTEAVQALRTEDAALLLDQLRSSSSQSSPSPARRQSRARP